MKIKNFQDYLEKRLNPEEIADIERQAKFEIEVLQSLLALLGQTPHFVFRNK